MHNHKNGQEQTTTGRTIPWARFYDVLVWIITLGKAKHIRASALAMAQLKAGQKVLDVGCGTGDLTLQAAKLAMPGGEVCGIDASGKMIEIAKKKNRDAGAQVNFQQGIMEQLNFSDNYFDVILCFLVMHHLPQDVKEKSLAEIKRVLKPGAHAVIVDLESKSEGNFLTRISDLIIHLHGGHKAMENNLSNLIPLTKGIGLAESRILSVNRQLSALWIKKGESE